VGSCGAAGERRPVSACSKFVLLYADGIGVTADLVGKSVVFTRSCASGDMAGCASLGHMLLNGIGGVEDWYEAICRLRLSCAAGTEEGWEKLSHALR
jgi:TPR repeat protein